MPTRLVFETLVKNGDLVQLVTFRCLGKLLEGLFELSRDKQLFHLKVLGFSVWRTDLAEERAGERREVREKAGIPWDLELLQAFLRAVRRLLRDVMKTISFEGFFCHLKVGMPDPAQTGIVLGMFHPITGMIQSVFPEDKIRVVVEPVWERAMLDVFARGTLRFRLASLVVPLTRFFLTGSVRKFLKLMKKKE